MIPDPTTDDLVGEVERFFEDDWRGDPAANDLIRRLADRVEALEGENEGALDLVVRLGVIQADLTDRLGETLQALRELKRTGGPADHNDLRFCAAWSRANRVLALPANHRALLESTERAPLDP